MSKTTNRQLQSYVEAAIVPKSPSEWGTPDTTAQHTPGPCPITPARLLWLQCLAKDGETPWGRMPKNSNNGSPRHMTNKTWRPMVEAGLITSRYGTDSFSGATTTNWYGTRAEAMACIKAQPSGTRFMMFVRGQAATETGDEFDCDQLVCSAQLSKPALLRAVSGCMRDTQEARGARIPFRVYESNGYRAFYLF